MIWLQGGASLVLWLAAGAWLSRRSLWERGALSRLGRQSRVLLGSFGFIFAGLILMVGGWLIATNGGVKDGALLPWAWAASTVLGLVFVSLQSLGAGAMLSLLAAKETARRLPPSNPPAGPQK